MKALLFFPILVTCAAVQAVEIDPIVTRWTFGAHEPFPMYRRVGRICTGAVDGNALWVKDWLDWWDAHAPEKMEELGFNFLHSRFYKGMGWEVEKKDFPNVKRFVANCHAHGVRTLAYVQFSTLYPEAMRREISQIDTWCGYAADGSHNLYSGQYFRWAPCLNCREWEDYVKRMCTIALTEGGFDGIMFDNVFDVPCYCKRCEAAFRAHLATLPDAEARFGFDDLSNILLPPCASLGQYATAEVRDPVVQAWAHWRCDTMTALLLRLRAHIKSVKSDAIVTGNPSPYRGRTRFIYHAQNMAELAKAFDVVIMQNDNFPETQGDRIQGRVRDLKFAQDAGQRIVALCDNVTNIKSPREAKFILPMLEDIVFGGIPTDRTTLFPSPEPGFIDSAVWNRRKPQHEKFNAFAKRHRTALSAPTVHAVRIFYPEREIVLSEATHQGVAAAEEIFLRNRVPYGYLVSTPDDVLTVPAGTEVLVVPGLLSLSDVQVEALVRYAQAGGKLVVTGDAGRYDDWNAQRRTNPLLPRLKDLPNVVVRAEADRLPKAHFGWSYTVAPPADGGAALMADLGRAGWKAPVVFEGLPPHVFAEYRRLADGALAVHLVNYRPEEPVVGAKATFADGACCTIPKFREYALLQNGTCAFVFD